MPHPLRVIEPDGIYHVRARGNDGRRIFAGDQDRVGFLTLLGRITEARRWRVYGYCLMDNHAHLLVRVPEADLSAGMQRLLGRYSFWWNRRHGHYGHLFLNRFPSTAVRRGSHLYEVARYIDLNPVRAGMTQRAEDWAWSSYRAHVGLEHPLPLLANSAFLRLFGATPDAARWAYRRFVSEGRPAVSDTGTKASRT